jgi:hypothetical protein
MQEASSKVPGRFETFSIAPECLSKIITFNGLLKSRQSDETPVSRLAEMEVGFHRDPLKSDVVDGIVGGYVRGQYLHLETTYLTHPQRKMI